MHLLVVFGHLDVIQTQLIKDEIEIGLSLLDTKLAELCFTLIRVVFNFEFIVEGLDIPFPCKDVLEIFKAEPGFISEELSEPVDVNSVFIQVGFNVFRFCFALLAFNCN